MKSSGRSYHMETRQAQVDDNRRRIMQAMLDLFVEMPYDHMTLDAIAARANTTRQTVIRQFGSKDRLAMATSDWQGALIADAHASPATPATAVEQLVERYERFGDINAKLGELEGRFEFADAGLARGRTNHRAWLEATWSTELDRLPAADREAVVDALYAATDVMVWKLLRRTFGRSPAATKEAMRRLVAGALQPASDQPNHTRS